MRGREHPPKYPRLAAEMVFRGIDRKDMAKAMFACATSISNKMNGKTSFTLEECKLIKRTLNSKLSIDKLFATAEEMEAKENAAGE